MTNSQHTIPSTEHDATFDVTVSLVHYRRSQFDQGEPLESFGGHHPRKRVTLRDGAIVSIEPI